MIYFRLFIGVFVLCLLFYYFLCILQLFDVVKFTNKEIKFPVLLIPFKYFFGMNEENNTNNECVVEEVKTEEVNNND